MAGFSVIWTLLSGIFSSINSTLTFLLILGFCFLFTMQIVSWMTGPMPSLGWSVAGGIFLGSVWTWAIYNYLPLAPSLVNASIVGVYGNPGYLWIFSLVFLLFVFGFNAFESWKSYKPYMELIQ